MPLLRLILVMLVSVLLVSCLATDEDRYAPLSLKAEGDVAYLNGSIQTDSFDYVTTFLAEHPQVKTLVFSDMPGSSDDETNLKIARFIRAGGYETKVLSDSIIESGAVDLFLAGLTRRGACGAQIGVHSWWDTAGYGPRDIARDHPDHALFIDYYEEMDVPEDLYWFTVEAAPPEGMLYMQPDDINRYKIVTEPLNCTENG